MTYAHRHRITCTLFLLFVFIPAFAAVSGCYRYVTIPVNTEVEALSVPYLLKIKNDTGGDIRILPNSTGQSKGFQAKLIGRGQEFETPLQVRKLKVGGDAATPTHEVVSTAYTESAGQPNVARILVEHGPQFLEKYKLDIDLESKDWFKSWEMPTPTPKTVVIDLVDFQKIRWFRAGPEKP